jgi:glycosyltransferase involved in cell wall biosynthesis
MNVGCDLRRFRPRKYSEKKILRQKFNIPQDKFIALFVGHLIRRKGLDILVKAIKNTNCQPSILTVIIGKGTLEKSLRSSICAEGLEDHFLVVGQKKHSELPQWFNLADVFVLPSRGEGTPTVLLEAMSTGLPIISTNVGGIPEILKDNESALFFPPEDYNRLADHLDTLFADYALRRKLSLNAQKNICDHSITGHAKKLIEIYKKSIQSIRFND